MDWLIASDSAFWLWATRASVLLSYLAVFSIGAFVFNLLRHRRQRTRLAAVSGKTAHPKALALCFGGGSIRSAVERYLSKAYAGRIEVESYEAKEITPQNVHKHTEALRRIKEKLQTEGVTELHLFMKGPVAMAFAVGAIFDNWVSVKVYQHARDGHAGDNAYASWMTLAQAKAAPIRDELGELSLKMVDSTPVALEKSRKAPPEEGREISTSPTT